MKFIGILSAATVALGLAQAAHAQGFDPRESCGAILNRAGQADQMMVAAWTFGYLAASNADPRPVAADNNATLLGNIKRACQANPQASLLDLVSASQQKPDATPAPTPGSEAEARLLLSQFLKPNADYRALTQALFPTEQDIRLVYSDPLASALVSLYARQMTGDVFFAPKPDQNALLMTYATTRALAERQPVLGEFPGGYRDVLQYFRTDVPIVRFKFVTQGETLGLAFDGLMHINGRWVIMPKPWSAL